jgi:hypothetical protein
MTAEKTSDFSGSSPTFIAIHVSNCLHGCYNILLFLDQPSRRCLWDTITVVQRPLPPLTTLVFLRAEILHYYVRFEILGRTMRSSRATEPSTDALTISGFLTNKINNKQGLIVDPKPTPPFFLPFNHLTLSEIPRPLLLIEILRSPHSYYNGSYSQYPRASQA